MRLSPLERLVLDAAAAGLVVVDFAHPDGEVRQVYRRLYVEGLLAVEHWQDDDLPWSVELTTEGLTQLWAAVQA
ncbi:hypothetical protein [Kineococcus sp. SYSU DK003]|uniref:hypothetical protein n=1 Tax=Kineococcus sp. SYSU DK003 TaxID=3383124 RepID=UPI003D7DB178